MTLAGARGDELVQVQSHVKAGLRLKHARHLSPLACCTDVSDAPVPEVTWACGKNIMVQHTMTSKGRAQTQRTVT